MGVFSMYTGIIYNDIFSKSLNIFGSHWVVNYNASTIASNRILQLDPRTDFTNTSYPFGMDPVWQVAPLNKIIFQNAYKMKISIIFGVFHMIFGVIMSLMNYRYFNDKMSVLTQFVPQIVFLVFLFLYMTLLMFIKWTSYAAGDGKYSEACAPSILITFINMVLFKYPDWDESQTCSPYMFAGQSFIQKMLVVLAMLCIPVMLFAKPFLIMKSRKENSVSFLF